MSETSSSPGQGRSPAIDAPVPGVLTPTPSSMSLSQPGGLLPVPVVVDSPERAFTRRALIVVGIALAAVLGVLLFLQIVQILVLVFAATLLAVLLTTPTNMLAKHLRVPRGMAFGIVLVTFLALAGTTVTFIGTTIRGEISEFRKTFPLALQQFEGKLQQSESGQWFLEQTREVRKNIGDYLTPEFFLAQAGGIATSTFGILGAALIVTVVGVYLSVSPSTYVQGFAALFPIRSRTRVREIMTAIGTTLQWWFFGQFLAMVEVFTLTFIGLKVLGMRSTLALSLLAGLFNVIPNFGPILAAIPAVILAAAPHDGVAEFDFKRMTAVIVLYACVQAIDAYVVSPFIQKRAVSLPPALIMLSQITAAILLGPLGLVVATPILAALLVLVRMAYVEDVLGDRRPEVQPPAVRNPQTP